MFASVFWWCLSAFLCCKGKKNLPRFVFYVFILFGGFFLFFFSFFENENQVHEDFFLFIWKAFGTDNHIGVYNLRPKFTWAKGACPLQNRSRRLCTRHKRMILGSTECHWGFCKCWTCTIQVASLKNYFQKTVMFPNP